jgi:hypothetical protein
MKANTAGRVYEKTVDRVSAHEILSKRATQLAEAEAREKAQAAHDKEAARSSRSRSSCGTTRARRTSSSRTTAVERQTGRVASGVFNTIVRELMRGILGTPSRRRR